MSVFGRYQTAQLQTALGQAVAGASVYFLTQPANTDNLTPLATVYANSTGAGGPVQQPLLTNGFGEFAAYLAPGVYTVVYISAITGKLIYIDQNVALGGGTPGTVTFDEIGSGTNTTAAMVVGSGASLTPVGSGRIKATDIDGVQVTGVPGTGQVIKATSPTAATWQDESAESGITSINGQTGPAITIAVGTGLAIAQSGNTITISLATVFTITSFTGGQTVELGFAVVNPAFSATYSITPASANITNTDGTDSPHNLTTPFTSATISGTFTHTSVVTVTFTLSAIQGTTQTATQTIDWEPRIFGGVGASGATSTVTASGNNAVLSTTDTIGTLQLGAETVGQIFGPFTPSGQCVYLLLKGGSHTFTDANTGFPFAMNAPISVSFVNQNGVTVSMFLYQSANPLFGSYRPQVQS